MQTWKQEAPKLAKIFVGNLILGIAYAKLMVPDKIINGGVTSLALVLAKVTKLDIVVLTNGLTVLLLLICWLGLGRATLLKSLFSSACYLGSFSFFSWLPLKLTTVLPVDLALACGLIALGYYCCLSAGSSTVGMDVLALIIHQHQPRWAVARIIRDLNFVVLLLGLVTYGWQAVVIGLIFSFVYAWLLDKLLVHYQQRIERQPQQKA
ncbi:YitT family protein [Lapidilactobacillus salsurivasis]